MQILLFAALFGAGYFLLVRWTGLQANLAESNLQANLIRISRYLDGPTPGTALVGSSVAGRLLPEYFPAGLDVRNLGLDGSGPLFGFEILHLRPALPRTMVLDTSTLFRALSSNDETLRREVQTPGFALSRHFPLLRPEYRLSSVIYSRLKGARDKGTSRLQPPFAENTRPAPVESDEPHTAGAKPEDQYVTVRDAVSSFRAQGVKVIVLSIPRGAGWGSPMGGLERRLATELSLPVFDPELAADGESLRFSDGMHLAAPSARRISKWIDEHLPQAANQSSPAR